MGRSSGRLANDAWESLLTAHARLMKKFAAEDVWASISMREYDVLYTLAKCPNSGGRQAVRMSELHRNVLLSQPALSRMVDRLVARGLVARVTDPADRRGVLLSLTEDGRTMQRRVGGGHAVGVSRAVNDRLTTAEQLELERLCRKLATPPDQATSRRHVKHENFNEDKEVAV